MDAQQSLIFSALVVMLFVPVSGCETHGELEETEVAETQSDGKSAQFSEPKFKPWGELNLDEFFEVPPTEEIVAERPQERPIGVYEGCGRTDLNNVAFVAAHRDRLGDVTAVTFEVAGETHLDMSDDWEAGRVHLGVAVPYVRDEAKNAVVMDAEQALKHLEDIGAGLPFNEFAKNLMRTLGRDFLARVPSMVSLGGVLSFNESLSWESDGVTNRHTVVYGERYHNPGNMRFGVALWYFTNYGLCYANREIKLKEPSALPS